MNEIAEPVGDLGIPNVVKALIEEEKKLTIESIGDIDFDCDEYRKSGELLYMS